MSGTPRILTVDIETAPMSVYTFSLFKPFISIDQIITPTRMISWAAKWHDEDEVIFRSEYHHGKDRMLSKLYELVDEADIIVHFNGDSFDIPHIQREFKQAKFPPVSPFQTVDLYKIAKKTMYFPSYKLDWISQELGVGRKLGHSGFQLWRECIEEAQSEVALARQKRAWSLMRRYNKQDVVLTEDLYVELLPYIPNHPHMGLFTEDPSEPHCSNCQGTDLKRRGYSYTKLARYPRYRCESCGKWSKGKKAEAIVDLRAA